MIILAPGGIGNQLFAIAAAFQMVKNRNEKVVVYSDSRELVGSFKSVKSKTRNPIKVTLTYSKFRKRFLSKFNGKMNYFAVNEILFYESLRKKFITAQNPHDIPDVFFKPEEKSPWLISGFFQDPDLVEGLGDDAKSFISNLLCKSNDSSNQKVLRTSRLIGIHIRRGDYQQIPSYGTLSMSYFSKTLHDIRNEGDSVLVASDDQNTLDKFALSENIDVISPLSNGPLKTIQELSEADIFIMSNSTFSFWVSWRISQKSGLIYSPIPWFKNVSVPENYLYPKGAVLVPAIFDE